MRKIYVYIIIFIKEKNYKFIKRLFISTLNKFMSEEQALIQGVPGLLRENLREGKRTSKEFRFAQQSMFGNVKRKQYDKYKKRRGTKLRSFEIIHCSKILHILWQMICENITKYVQSFTISNNIGIKPSDHGLVDSLKQPSIFIGCPQQHRGVLQPDS